MLRVWVGVVWFDSDQKQTPSAVRVSDLHSQPDLHVTITDPGSDAMVAILSYSMSADLWPAEPVVPSLRLARTWYFATTGREWWLALGERQHGVVQAAQRAGAQREPFVCWETSTSFTWHTGWWFPLPWKHFLLPASGLAGNLSQGYSPPSLPPALPHSLNSPPRPSKHTLPSDKVTVTLRQQTNSFLVQCCGATISSCSWSC